MVTLCGRFRPAELRRLGGHLLEVVAPEIAEAEEAKRLQNQEQQARAKTSLRTRLIGDGLARTTIVHPELDRDRLLTYLHASTSPRKPRSSSAATARSSTWAAPAGCSHPPNAKPCGSATRNAAPSTARSPPPGARPIIGNPGPKAATPTSTTAYSSAASTTTAPTTNATKPPPSRPATSATTDAPRPASRTSADPINLVDHPRRSLDR